MKKIDWNKAGKTIGIIAVIALIVLFFESRNIKRQKLLDEHIGNLSSAIDELDEIRSRCDDGMNTESEEEMYSALSDIQEKCRKISERIENTYNYLLPEEPDDDAERRSWFY